MQSTQIKYLNLKQFSKFPLNLSVVNFYCSFYSNSNLSILIEIPGNRDGHRRTWILFHWNNDFVSNASCHYCADRTMPVACSLLPMLFQNFYIHLFDHGTMYMENWTHEKHITKKQPQTIKLTLPPLKDFFVYFRKKYLSYWRTYSYLFEEQTVWHPFLAVARI